MTFLAVLADGVMSEDARPLSGKYVAIDRESIELLVRRFYEDVRADVVLSPIFTATLGDQWEAHQQLLVEFWSTLTLGTRSYSGNVFGKHRLVEGLAPEHFRRWLTLWFEHTEALFETPCAVRLQATAAGIARSLYRGYVRREQEFEVIESELRRIFG